MINCRDAEANETVDYSSRHSAVMTNLRLNQSVVTKENDNTLLNINNKYLLTGCN